MGEGVLMSRMAVVVRPYRPLHPYNAAGEERGSGMGRQMLAPSEYQRCYCTVGGPRFEPLTDRCPALELVYKGQKRPLAHPK